MNIYFNFQYKTHFYWKKTIWLNKNAFLFSYEVGTKIPINKKFSIDIWLQNTDKRIVYLGWWFSRKKHYETITIWRKKDCYRNSKWFFGERKISCFRDKNRIGM